MASCTAIGCRNRKGRKSKRQLLEEKNGKITFHRFPKDEKRRMAWLAAMKRNDWVPTEYSRLCSVHFAEECFIRTSSPIRLLEDSVPSIFNSAISHSAKQKGKESNENNCSNEEEDLQIEVECLICRCKLNDCDEICADSIMDTGTTMEQKLNQIMNDVYQKPWNGHKNESLCYRCAQLVKFVDKMESELVLLKNALAGCILSKGSRHELKEEVITNLLVLDEFYDKLCGICSNEEQDNRKNHVYAGSSKEDGKIGAQLKLERDESEEPKVYQCKLCLLKTSSQSVLLFHLRRHMANHQWCDFCDVSLSNEDSS